MFWLDNPSGVPAMPPLKAVHSATKLWFTEGGNGTSPSYPGEDWFNIVSAELLNILEQANVSPSKTDLTQLATAIKALCRAVAISDGVYKRSNIVGAVSQSAGIPAGAIIERGDNANGKYTRLADGTLIQWLPSFRYTGSVAAGAVGNFGAKPLPSSFVDTSYIALCSTSGMASSATSAVKVSLEQRAQAQIGNVVIGNASNASVDLSTFDIQTMLIGRWY